MKKTLITLMRSIYVLCKFLPSDSIINNPRNDFSIDYKISSNIYDHETFLIYPQKHQLKTDFNFAIELEYLTKAQIQENNNKNKRIGKNKFIYRRPRFFSDNVECNKKFEIINFDSATIEDNYFLNKLNSKSKLEGLKKNNIETIDSLENTIEYDIEKNCKSQTSNPYYSENYTIIYDDESDCSIGNDREKSDLVIKDKDIFSVEKDSLKFSNQKKIYSENNKVQERRLIDSDDLLNNCISLQQNLNSLNNFQNQLINNNHNLSNLNYNHNHSYRIRNKRKDFKEKDEMRINFIKNSNTLSNPENIMKFNKFNLKNYYQNKNRNKNKLVKINENSESESDSIKKMQIKTNKDSIGNIHSVGCLERIDSRSLNANLCDDNNISDLKEESLKNGLKQKENKDTSNTISKLVFKDEKDIKDNHVFKKRKETISNDSDYRDLIRLKNLNTNDTTSLRSSESSISKTNSFQLDYNSDNEEELEHSVILSDDEKVLLKNKTNNKDNFFLAEADEKLQVIQNGGDDAENILNLNDSANENEIFNKKIEIINHFNLNSIENTSIPKNKLIEGDVNIKKDLIIHKNLDAFLQKFKSLSINLSNNLEYENNILENNPFTNKEFNNNNYLVIHEENSYCNLNFKIFKQFSEERKIFFEKNNYYYNQ